jgi:hypothetical protein
MLRPLAGFACRAKERDKSGHFPSHLSLDDFTQRNVRGAEMFNAGDERPACSAAAGR